MKYKFQNQKGFTLIEVAMAVVIAGILAAVAMRSTVAITEAGRTEITKTEMNDIAFAMVGNSDLQNNKTRTDFGYVGDVGAMPPNLAALMTNPGAYTTWKGPYIKNRFSQVTNDYSQDAWGVNYTFSGVDIASTGSGSTIVHKIGEATSHFLINKVSGNIYDSDGTPPGSIYKDSISILLTIPNGVGGTITKGISPDFGGYFSFDSIPIGNHDIQLVYAPTSDTLKRFVSTTPKSSVYDEYLFSTNIWTTASGGGGSTGGLVYLSGSAQTTGQNCDKFNFNLQNTSSANITITTITTSWTTPVSFFNHIKIGVPKVYHSHNPRTPSGQIANITSITINAGSTVTLTLDGFVNSITGGTKTNISNTDITMTFSDGSVITFNTGVCP